MESCKILLPYNFTPQDHKAMDFVIRTFAGQENAEVCVFHAYTPLPAMDTSRSTVMEKMQSSLTYLNQRLKEQESDLEAAARVIADSGFGSSRVRAVFQPRKRDVAGDIVEQTQKSAADIVVLSHTTGKIARFFTGTTYAKVVAMLKGITVCIVS